MSDVNKQLLEAVKHCHGIFDQYVSHHLAKPDYDKAAANERHRAICADAIAAAEQAQADIGKATSQQAQPRFACGDSFTSDAVCANCLASTQAVPVAREFFAYDPECGFETFRTEAEAKKYAQDSIDSYREEASEGWPELVNNICWGVVLGATREVELPDEYNGCNGLAGYMKPVDYVLTDAAQPPAKQQAEPVARDWPKLLEMARQIIRDGHVHDVSGGDLAVTTCEAFEGLDAFLKQHFPEPLGELTGMERKWFETKAVAQPPAVAVPDGYAHIPPASPVPLTDGDYKTFKLGWLECEAAHRAILAAAPQG